MSLSLLSQVLLAAEEGDEFEAPSVEHSFFFDKIGDGTVIASVKAMVLLVLGIILIIGFLLAASRKAAMLPGKLQFAGEAIYGFVRNGVAIEILGGQVRPQMGRLPDHPVRSSSSSRTSGASSLSPSCR